MQFADEHGIMIIDECPSVDTEYVSECIFEREISKSETFNVYFLNKQKLHSGTSGKA